MYFTKTNIYDIIIKTFIIMGGGNMNITINADAVAIVSAIIALIAMFVSIWQAVIARHIFKLQKQLYEE